MKVTITAVKADVGGAMPEVNERLARRWHAHEPVGTTTG